MQFEATQQLDKHDVPGATSEAAFTSGARRPAHAVPAAERRRRQRPEAGTKPIDLTYLGRFTLGDRALESEVLALYVKHAPQYLAGLANAATAKAWHDAAHTLKGASRGIGAWRVARCAETAERLRFDTDFDRRTFALDSAAEAMDEAIGFIGTLSDRG